MRGTAQGQCCSLPKAASGTCSSCSSSRAWQGEEQHLLCPNFPVPYGLLIHEGVRPTPHSTGTDCDLPSMVTSLKGNPLNFTVQNCSTSARVGARRSLPKVLAGSDEQRGQRKVVSCFCSHQFGLLPGPQILVHIYYFP